MLENELAKEIKWFLGNPTDRLERIKIVEKLKEAAKDMGEINRYNHAEAFAECLHKHGRAAVSVCIAATLWELRGRLGNWNFNWAIDVLNLWTWKMGEHHIYMVSVHGKSHPTTICDYAGKFIKVNSV